MCLKAFVCQFSVIWSILAFLFCTLKVCEPPTHLYTHGVLVFGGVNPQIEGDMLQHVLSFFCVDGIVLLVIFKRHLWYKWWPSFVTTVSWCVNDSCDWPWLLMSSLCILLYASTCSDVCVSSRVWWCVFGHVSPLPPSHQPSLMLSFPMRAQRVYKAL